MDDNRSEGLNSWHTCFTVKDDIQEFMEITYYMMGIVNEFIGASDISTYGGFRDNEFRIFQDMYKEMDDIIERRKTRMNKQDASLAV